MFQEAKFSWELSKVFQRTKCVQEESVPGSKNVLRRKVFWRANYDSARYVQEAKCSEEQSFCQHINMHYCLKNVMTDCL